MTTEALISTIIAVVSLLVSVGTAVLTQRMKHRTDLAMAKGNARRDYEYEARKRLYSEFEPLQFRMVELCEAAYERAALSVESVQTGRLAARYSGDWLTDPYAMLSTVYELTAPLVLFQIGRTRLTLSDLNLDEDIKRQYLLSKELYLVWRSGTELAESSPAVSYDDTFYSDRQVPLPRYLDELLTSLLADGDTARLMDFREYYKLGAAGEITELEHLTRPFTNFHPSTRAKASSL